MKQQQPALGCLDRHRSCTNLHALPGALLERGGSHHVAVVTPVFQIGGLGVEYVSECRVAGVTRTGEKGELAVYLPREEDSVPVVRQEGILKLVECPEVVRPGKADCRTVIAVAPGHVVLSVNLGHSRVVSVDPLADFRISALETDGLGIDVPIQSVFREAGVQGHPAVLVVTSENSGVAPFERDHGGVEYAV